MNGSNDLLLTSLNYIGLVAPIWLPILLGWVAWQMFVRYNHKRFFASQKYVVLEIRVPKEVNKSPAAMELFLNTIWQTAGETTWYDRNFVGKTRAWFSLEIVSIDGFLHFFIWSRATFKRHIEAQIYAQYPGAEVTQVQDYSKQIKYDPKVNAMFGLEYELKKADPYPIKTYIDYGLDQTSTEEDQKIDPISQVLEFFGQISKGEQMWLQIICRAHKGEQPDPSKMSWWNPFSWLATYDKWKAEAKTEIEKIRKDTTSKYEDPVTGTKRDGFPNPTKGQTEVINALERSISKPGFDVGIRSIYIGNKDVFSGPSIPILVAVLKPYNSGSLNSFGPKNLTNFDYPWQDFNDIRKNKLKREMLDAYKKRSYFYSPVKEKPMVLNAEELATIFHFPGLVVQTPTFGRIMSKKAEPPSNLPI